MGFTVLKEFRRGQTCRFCNTSDNDPALLGAIYKYKDIVVHYFCMLLSSKIEQKGKDEEGILGFLSFDIKKEVRRGQQIICCYCKKPGATLECSDCYSKYFHLPCGRRNRTLHQFFGEFKTFCRRHRVDPKLPDYVKGEDLECVICVSPVHHTQEIIWPSCCRPHTLLHKSCIQRMAANAGYYVKCPLCNNDKEYTKQLKIEGVHVPDEEASWERERNAFAELRYQNVTCEAEPCKCKHGRQYSFKNSKWYLEHCNLCGSNGIHRGCSEHRVDPATYQCSLCSRAVARLDNNRPTSIEDDNCDSDDEASPALPTRTSAIINVPITAYNPLTKKDVIVNPCRVRLERISVDFINRHLNPRAYSETNVQEINPAAEIEINHSSGTNNETGSGVASEETVDLTEEIPRSRSPESDTEADTKGESSLNIQIRDVMSLQYEEGSRNPLYEILNSTEEVKDKRSNDCRDTYPPVTDQPGPSRYYPPIRIHSQPRVCVNNVYDIGPGGFAITHNVPVGEDLIGTKLINCDESISPPSSSVIMLSSSSDDIIDITEWEECINRSRCSNKNNSQTSSPKKRVKRRKKTTFIKNKRRKKLNNKEDSMDISEDTKNSVSYKVLPITNEEQQPVACIDLTIDSEAIGNEDGMNLVSSSTSEKGTVTSENSTQIQLPSVVTNTEKVCFSNRIPCLMVDLTSDSEACDKEDDINPVQNCKEASNSCSQIQTSSVVTNAQQVPSKLVPTENMDLRIDSKAGDKEDAISFVSVNKVLSKNDMANSDNPTQIQSSSVVTNAQQVPSKLVPTENMDLRLDSKAGDKEGAISFVSVNKVLSKNDMANSDNSTQIQSSSVVTNAQQVPSKLVPTENMDLRIDSKAGDKEDAISFVSVNKVLSKNDMASSDNSTQIQSSSVDTNAQQASSLINLIQSLSVGLTIDSKACDREDATTHIKIGKVISPEGVDTFKNSTQIHKTGVIKAEQVPSIVLPTVNTNIVQNNSENKEFTLKNVEVCINNDQTMDEFIEDKLPENSSDVQGINNLSDIHNSSESQILYEEKISHNKCTESTLENIEESANNDNNVSGILRNLLLKSCPQQKCNKVESITIQSDLADPENSIIDKTSTAYSKSTEYTLEKVEAKVLGIKSQSQEDETSFCAFENKLIFDKNVSSKKIEDNFGKNEGAVNEQISDCKESKSTISPLPLLNSNITSENSTTAENNNSLSETNASSIGIVDVKATTEAVDLFEPEQDTSNSSAVDSLATPHSGLPSDSNVCVTDKNEVNNSNESLPPMALDEEKENSLKICDSTTADKNEMSNSNESIPHVTHDENKENSLKICDSTTTEKIEMSNSNESIPHETHDENKENTLKSFVSTTMKDSTPEEAISSKNDSADKLDYVNVSSSDSTPSITQENSKAKVLEVNYNFLNHLSSNSILPTKECIVDDENSLEIRNKDNSSSVFESKIISLTDDCIHSQQRSQQLCIESKSEFFKPTEISEIDNNSRYSQDSNIGEVEKSETRRKRRRSEDIGIQKAKRSPHAASNQPEHSSGFARGSDIKPHNFSVKGERGEKRVFDIEKESDIQLLHELLFDDRPQRVSTRKKTRTRLH